jgi:uncharacterized protein (TIGR03435 family)
MLTRLFLLALLTPVAALAQAPAFEVASVKVASSPGNCRGGPGTTTPGQWNCTTSLRSLVTMAWGIKDYQLVAPSSLENELLNIVAKLPPGASKPGFYLMIQQVLTSRLGVAVHHEKREQTVYDLTVAKGGPKLKDAAAAPAGGPPLDANGFPVKFVRDAKGNAQLPSGRMGVREMRVGADYLLDARFFTAPQIANLLEGQVEHPVIDRTGLTGKYDFDLRFLPDPNSPAGRMMPPASTEPSTPSPSVFEAVVQQLGLQLTPHKGPVDILVVDRFLKEPSEN